MLRRRATAISRWYRKLSFLCLMAIWLTVFPVRVETEPHFGSGIVFVGNLGEGSQLRPFDEMLLPLDISRTGTIVAAIANRRLNSEKATSLYIWHLNAADPQGEFSSPAPTSSLLLDSSDDFPAVSIALSPDEKFLALWFKTLIQLLSVPDLNVIKTIPTTTEPTDLGLAWTSDSNKLAISEEAELVLWNIQADSVRHYPLTGNHLLVPFGEEWLLTPVTTHDGSELFTICSQELEKCTSYGYPGELGALSPDGKIIVTRRYTAADTWVFGVWARQANGKYTLTEGMFDEQLVVSPDAFSPSGQYLFLNTRSGSEIWDFTTAVPIQTWPYNRQSLELVDDLAWLANDEFFVTLENHNFKEELVLYCTGQKTPLDTLNLDDIVKAQGTSIDGELFGIKKVSEDGHWVAIGIGPAVLMIPVVYP